MEEIHFLSLTVHKCSKGMLNRLEPFSPKGTLLNEGGQMIDKENLVLLPYEIPFDT